MKIYFLSALPCALTVNDAYFGLVDNFERFAEIELSDSLFLRFTPESAQPIAFFLTEDIRFRPPQGVEVYLLPDALAVYAKDFPPRDLTFRPVAQNRANGMLASVFYQGALQFTLQTGEQFFCDTLPSAFDACSIAFESAFITVRSKSHLAVYSFSGERLFCERAREYNIEENRLRVKIPLSDYYAREAECVYEYADGKFTRTGYTLSQARATVTENAREELIFYAFLESVRLGADCAPFLCDDLSSSEEKLRGFLGDFLSTTITDSPTRCGLVYQKGDRVYEVKYYTAVLQGGKIADIRG